MQPSPREPNSRGLNNQLEKGVGPWLFLPENCLLITIYKLEEEEKKKISKKKKWEKLTIE
jgi:hypothetical protein